MVHVKLGADCMLTEHEGFSCACTKRQQIKTNMISGIDFKYSICALRNRKGTFDVRFFGLGGTSFVSIEV